MNEDIEKLSGSEVILSLQYLDAILMRRGISTSASSETEGEEIIHMILRQFDSEMDLSGIRESEKSVQAGRGLLTALFNDDELREDVDEAVRMA